MQRNVLERPNHTKNPTGNMTSTVHLRKLQTTGITHRFASFLNRAKAAGDLSASTTSMNDRRLTPSNEMVFTFVTIVVVCMVNCGLPVLAADEEPVAAERPSKGPSPEKTAQPTPSSVSPDKKWEYRPDESAQRIVKAGTDVVAFDLSDQPAGNGFSFATVIWAPDSKRFAFNYGQGREHATSLYQLRDDHWVALKSPSDVDEISNLPEGVV